MVGSEGRGEQPASVWSLLRGDVVHLDPQEAMWTAMQRGWRMQQGARMLSQTTISTRVRAVERFFEFTGEYPWAWQAADIEAWTVELRSRQRAYSTIRSYQMSVAMFCDYLVDARYGWGEACFERFGTHPVQVCHEWNVARHVSEFESNPRVRPFTTAEVQALFDFADEQVVRAAASGRKGALAAFRDATLLKTTYAFGLRRGEVTKLAVTDFHRNSAAPGLGSLGSCLVRYGKASKGSPPRRRTVLTVFPWIVGVMEEYLEDVRPMYGVGQRTMMWPTERGGRVSASYLEGRFRQYIDGAGLPGELRLHSLRHSYVTHLVEAGWDPYFIQQQVGHAWASTTSIYAGVSSDYMNTMLRQALGNAVADGVLESRGVAARPPSIGEEGAGR